MITVGGVLRTITDVIEPACLVVSVALSLQCGGRLIDINAIQPQPIALVCPCVENSSESEVKIKTVTA